MKRYFVLLTSLFFLLLSHAGYSQRQTRGRGSIDGFMTFSTLDNGRFGVSGGGANWKMYQYLTHVSVGAEVSMLPVRVDLHTDAVKDKTTGEILIPENNEHFEHLAYDICAGGGYYIRLLAPRSRVVILSVGVNAYAGVRYCDAMGSYSAADFDSKIDKGADNDKAVSKVGFVLNVTPELLFEVFPSRNFSLFLSCRPRMTCIDLLKGSSDWLKCYAGFGVKYYL